MHSKNGSQRSQRNAGPLGVISKILQRSNPNHHGDSRGGDYSTRGISQASALEESMSLSSISTTSSSIRSVRQNTQGPEKSRNVMNRSTRAKRLSPTDEIADDTNPNSHIPSHTASTSIPSSNNTNAGTTTAGFSPERVAGAYPPVGLSGPATFVFSPGPPSSATKSGNSDSTTGSPLHSAEDQGRYLTFLSCYASNNNISNTTNNSNLEQPIGTTASGSPIRTMGGGTGTSGSGGGGGFGERRIYAMDMSPFWEHIRTMDAANMNMMSNSPTNSDFPVIEPNKVMETFTAPLLNSSAQNNDNHGGNAISPSSSTAGHSKYSFQNYKSPTPKNSRSGDGGVGITGSPDSKISLEERLRRERQRLHSNGVTQFSWVNMGNIPTTKQYQQQPVPMRTSLSPQRRSPTQRPRPERKPSPPPPNTSSLDRKIGPQSPMFETESTGLRILVPYRGNIYIQDGVGSNAVSPLRLLYEKSMLEDSIYSPSTPLQSNLDRRGAKRSGVGGSGQFSNDSSVQSPISSSHKPRTSGSAVGRDAGAIDPQLSPDGKMVAFVVAGEIYVISCESSISAPRDVRDESGDHFDRRNDCDSMDYNLNSKENSTNETEVSSRMPIRVTFGAQIDGCDEDMQPHFLHDDDDTDDNSRNSYNHCCNPRHNNEKEFHGHSVTNGLADFVAQEEMDRYRGFWWDKKSEGILFVQVDESCVPPYRITHQGHDGNPGDEATFEDHRYPFAGEMNPDVTLGYVKIDRKTIMGQKNHGSGLNSRDEDGTNQRVSSYLDKDDEELAFIQAQSAARLNWSKSKWFQPPSEASEYLARVSWLPDDTVCVQWQDRLQSTLVLVRVNVDSGETMTLLKEESGVWINLHHMFRLLPKPIHPNECLFPDDYKNGKTPPSLPEGSFSFLFASERTGFCHLYLYTFIPGNNSATLIRAVSAGKWIVDSIVGVDMENSVVYVTGTFDSPLEKRLYALPLTNPNICTSQDKMNQDTGGGINVRRGLQHVMHTISGAASLPMNATKSNVKDDDIFGSWAHPDPLVTSPPPDPICLTTEAGMHSIVMDDMCRIVVDTSSDLSRPTSTKIYYIPLGGPYRTSSSRKRTGGELELLCVPYDAKLELDADVSLTSSITGYPPPELISFPTADGTEILHAALYRPDPKIHGPGPYALICAVYGGPHVQRVNRSWCQSVDMRVQRLCSLGFAVVKCDNRGSSRRGLAFEGAIKKRLGRIEVIDQVTAVRQLVMRGIADPARVGIYGWSYGGYLAAMCLCRAPEVFHVAIAGAPVTSWDGYDTHYTERYMGLPKENPDGYHESAIFHHVPNMKGKLMIVHGLIDENVHFRHTARLVNRLIAAGKDYDILIFPDERHSPRKLRDRIYMEKRMSDYFVTNLLGADNRNRPRAMLGHL